MRDEKELVRFIYKHEHDNFKQLQARMLKETSATEATSNQIIVTCPYSHIAFMQPYMDTCTFLELITTNSAFKIISVGNFSGRYEKLVKAFISGDKEEKDAIIKRRRTLTTKPRRSWDLCEISKPEDLRDAAYSFNREFVVF